MREKLVQNPPELVCTAHSGVENLEKAFALIEKVAKGSKKAPFDETAPFDVMK